MLLLHSYCTITQEYLCVCGKKQCSHNFYYYYHAQGCKYRYTTTTSAIKPSTFRLETSSYKTMISNSALFVENVTIIDPQEDKKKIGVERQGRWCEGVSGLDWPLSHTVSTPSQTHSGIWPDTSICMDILYECHPP